MGDFWSLRGCYSARDDGVFIRFMLLALGCQRLAWLFRTPVIWRCLDAGVALLMVYLAGMLITDSLDILQVVLEGNQWGT